MPHQLTLDLSDPLFEAVQRAAERSGKSPEQWIQERLQTQLAVPPERQTARARLMRHVGAVNVPDASGTDNESIDRDLARAYEDPHEERH